MFIKFDQRPTYDGKLEKMWQKDKNYKSQNIRTIPFPNFKRLKMFERGCWRGGGAVFPQMLIHLVSSELKSFVRC